MNPNAKVEDRRPKGWTVWVGRVLTALPILMMLFSASMKLARTPQLMEQWVGTFGYSEGSLLGIAVLELTCVLLYAIPRTAVLGAVLVTGYLGGAIATHVRIGDPSFLGALALGVVAWAGLYLREKRLHALMPLRKK